MAPLEVGSLTPGFYNHSPVITYALQIGSLNPKPKPGSPTKYAEQVLRHVKALLPQLMSKLSTNAALGHHWPRSFFFSGFGV